MQLKVVFLLLNNVLKVTKENLQTLHFHLKSARCGKLQGKHFLISPQISISPCSSREGCFSNSYILK